MKPWDNPVNWSNPRACCDGPEPWHGTLGGYSYHRCRGDACREAKAAYVRHYRTGRAAPKAVAWVGRAGPPPPPVFVPDTLTLGEYLEARA